MKKLIIVFLLISLNSYAGDLTEIGGGGRTNMVIPGELFEGGDGDGIGGGDGSGGGMPATVGPLKISRLRNMEEYLDAKDLLENGIRNFRFEDGSRINLPRAVSHFERSARF